MYIWEHRKQERVRPPTHEKFRDRKGKGVRGILSKDEGGSLGLQKVITGR